jgi:hypothetical protein
MIRRYHYILVMIVLLGAVFVGAFSLRTEAATGVPRIISYQGRLLDSSGNLLGGSGTTYCFRFSLYNASSAGTQVWPSSTPSIMSATVANGIFDIGIGDTSAGGDALTYNFQDSDSIYLNVQVAELVDPVCTGGSEVFETLTPRERVVASGYAINAYSVDGYSASTNASGTEIPVIASDTLTLAGVDPQINATGTNTLTLQGGAGTGDIQFFSSLNSLSSTGTLSLAGAITGSMLQATATSSQLLFHGVGGNGTLTWTPTTNEALTIPNFGTATDTLALVNFAQTLNNKTLANATLTQATAILGLSVIQNVAATGLTLGQNAAGTALAITNVPASAQASSTVSIVNGANVSGAALLVSNYGTGNALQVSTASSTVFSITNAGTLVFQPAADTATAVTLKNASGTDVLFTADTLNNKVKIGDNGAAGTIPTLFGLDVKADAGDPTGFPGAMYYSSSTNQFRCYQGTAWYNCVPTNMNWQSAFFTSRWGYWAPTGINATAFTSVNMVAPTVNGTGAASPQAEDDYVQWTSTTTTASVAGLTQGFTQTEARYTPRLATRIRTDTTIANRRIWVALSSAALTKSDGTGTLTTIYYGVRYSTSAGDTTWQCASGDGTTGSVVNTGVTVTTSTYYDIVIDASTPGQLTCMIATNGGNYVSTVKTTNIPASTSATALGITDAATTLAAAAVVHRSAYVYLGGRN